MMILSSSLFSKRVENLDIVVGFVDEDTRHRFYIASAYLSAGRVLHVHHKVYLPTYALFDEGRFFAHGDSIRAFDTRFGRMGMLICEDFWHASPPYLLWLDGADVLLFSSASPGRGLFIKLREKGYESKTPKQIAQGMFRLGDGCTMSAKKDGMANIGGFLCTNDDLLAQQEKDLLILTEGYPTYGGLAGRDLEAIAVGIQEALEEDYLRYRIASTAYLGNHIAAVGVPIVQPPGGHAIYLDARAFLSHIPADQFPGVALAAELYLEGGVRSVEIGTLMFAASAQMDLVRLAIPRRVYTQSHIDYLVEVIIEVWKKRESIRGMRLTHEAPFLRHFTAHLEPVS